MIRNSRSPHRDGVTAGDLSRFFPRFDRIFFREEYVPLFS